MGRGWASRRLALLAPALAVGALWVTFPPLRALIAGPQLLAVVPGEVYRSGQPSASTLERWIDGTGLRTVVNLQGTQRRKPWFIAERRAAETRGVGFHVLRLHPKRMPRAQDLRKLLELIENEPRPILLHCRLGVDRSGLAAATALLAEGREPAEARHQLSLRYGHVPWVSGSNLLAVLDDYERWLLRRPHSPERFRTWVQDHYVPDIYRARIESIDFPVATLADGAHSFRFRVTNTSPRSWSGASTGDGGVVLGAHLKRLSVQTHTSHELRGRGQPFSLAPEEQAQVDLEIPAGLDAGHYVLTVDMVHEGRAWFADMGSEPLQIEFDVDGLP